MCKLIVPSSLASVTSPYPSTASYPPSAGADLNQLDLFDVANTLLSDQVDNQSTFGYKLLAAKPRPAQPGQEQYYELEYVVQVCRGGSSIVIC